MSLESMHTPSFDVGGAQKFLSFAIQFTPQYGDTFMEVLRIEVLAQVFIPRVLILMGLPVEPFWQFLTTDLEADIAQLTTSPAAMYALTLLNFPPPTSRRRRKWTSNARPDIGSKVSLPLMELIGAPAASSDREWRVTLIKAILNHKLPIQVSLRKISRLFLKNLDRRCVNADPNYGVGWFFCRKEGHGFTPPDS